METNRIKLEMCNLALLDAILKGNEDLSAFLGAEVPNGWSEFGEPAFQWTKKALETDPESAQWLAYLPVLKAENTLIGSCGYTGAPKDATVEIGYEIAAPWRNQGYATEIAKSLVAHAFSDPLVKKVIAHTLAEPNASTRVLMRSGFKKVGAFTHPEDGPVWKWEIRKKENMWQKFRYWLKFH